MVAVSVRRAVLGWAMGSGKGKGTGEQTLERVRFPCNRRAARKHSTPNGSRSSFDVRGV